MSALAPTIFALILSARFSETVTVRLTYPFYDNSARTPSFVVLSCAALPTTCGREPDGTTCLNETVALLYLPLDVEGDAKTGCNQLNLCSKSGSCTVHCAHYRTDAHSEMRCHMHVTTTFAAIVLTVVSALSPDEQILLHFAEEISNFEVCS